MFRSTLMGLLLFTVTPLVTVAAPPVKQPDWTAVPGVVINHSPASSGKYIGSPSIAVLDDGTYLASHDEFGPKSSYRRKAVTRVFASNDRGRTWEPISRIAGALWSTLFTHDGALYLLGTDRRYGHVVIRRSDDGGRTWTTPSEARGGRLTEADGYHTAPMPMLVHDGRLWRTVEDNRGPAGRWAGHFRARVMSAPVDGDLLDRANWTFSEPLACNPRWFSPPRGKSGPESGWLEGNIVRDPAGRLVNLLRVETPEGNHAAITHVDGPSAAATFNPTRDIIDMPGGDKKFTIRYDPSAKRYWALTNPAPDDLQGVRMASWVRNTLVLISSPDLRTWTIHRTLLHHPDPKRHGFQYLDWRFDGSDIIAVSRTAYDDGLGGAHNAHDANFLTFHRFEDFRETVNP